jgi:hypothetical protein
MSTTDLELTAHSIVANGKGILAAHGRYTTAMEAGAAA